MTRKQALQEVLYILEQQEQSDKTIQIQEKIQELIDELPLTKWTEKRIFDTCNQFIVEKNKIPAVADFKSKGLPPHTVIKLRFGIELKEFLNTYYPSTAKCYSKVFGHKSKEEWLQLFVQEYEQIKPSSAGEYNGFREKGSPAWQTIAKLFGVSKWEDFKNICKVQTYTKDKTLKQLESISLNVRSFSDYDAEIEKFTKNPVTANEQTTVFEWRTKDDLLEFFIQEYNRIRPTSAEYYNEHRQSNTPTWQTIAKLYDIEEWSILLSYCKIIVYTKQKVNKKVNQIDFKIKRYSDYDVEIEK